MSILVTGSSGHLGEALVRTLRAQGERVIGLDIEPSPYTDRVGSIGDRDCVRECLKGVRTVYHTATLHKPHIGTHSKSDFVDVNVQGTLALLEESCREVDTFICTSTTSVFGNAMRPGQDEPAVWVTEDVRPAPRNIYGVTKAAAEDLCELFHRQHGFPCIVLRTSRFFPEEDDNQLRRERYSNDNLKANEFLYRRVDLEDVVSAHRLASERAAVIGFGKYIISATTPFQLEDLADLRQDAVQVVRRRAPGFEAVYERLGWRMFDGIGRVYINEAARRDLQWTPRIDFAHVLRCLEAGEDPRSPLAVQVGAKGYHNRTFDEHEGPYPVT